MSPFYFSILSLLHVYRNPLQFFIFILSLKQHSEDLFTIIFRSSIIHRCLPPKFCMGIVFDFFLGISTHHKRDRRQFAYAKFWGVNKVFYGQCKNGEYVNNFYTYIIFLISHIKNVGSTFLKISFVQSPFKNCLALFFFLFWIWNKFVYEKILLYSQLSLTKHLFKTDHPRLVLPPRPLPLFSQWL